MLAVVGVGVCPSPRTGSSPWPSKSDREGERSGSRYGTTQNQVERRAVAGDAERKKIPRIRFFFSFLFSPTAWLMVGAVGKRISGGSLCPEIPSPTMIFRLGCSTRHDTTNAPPYEVIGRVVVSRIEFILARRLGLFMVTPEATPKCPTLKNTGLRASAVVKKTAISFSRVLPNYGSKPMFDPHGVCQKNISPPDRETSPPATSNSELDSIIALKILPSFFQARSPVFSTAPARGRRQQKIVRNRDK